jgi:hypothetical protein
MNLRPTPFRILCVLTIVFFAAGVPMRAQDSGPGPMRPPDSEKFPTPPPPTKPEAPPLPPDEIIRKFAAKEDEMVRAILGYTFQKSVRIEEIGPDSKPSGQLEILSQQTISPDGKVYEKPLKRAPSTLHVLDIERGDTGLLASTPLFPLTTAQLPKYEITYGGEQPLDELNAYFFVVKPRTLERARAYFSGVVWVDKQDLVIVKSIGKWVTETGDVTSPELPFSVFEIYRQQVGKSLWFPAYSRSDETIDSSGKRVSVRMVIRWTDFKAPGTDAPAGAASVPVKP